MAIDLTPLISGGYVDNTKENTVVLGLSFPEKGDPLEIEMEGNCLRDIAGGRLSFKPTVPPEPFGEAEERLYTTLKSRHEFFRLGDMTASARQTEKNARHMLCNALSLEFFDISGERFTIESAFMKLTMEEFTRSHTPWEDMAQRMINRDAYRQYTQQRINRYISSRTSAEKGFQESEWDRKLLKAEATAAIFHTVQERYADDPQRKVNISYALEWFDFLSTLADADEGSYPLMTDVCDRQATVLDFLSPKDAEIAYDAMHEPLFQRISELSSGIQKHYNSRSSYGAQKRKALKQIVDSCGFIVPHLLGTLILVNQGEASDENVVARIKKITNSLDGVLELIGKHKEWSNLHSPAGNLREELLDYLIDHTWKKHTES